MRTCVGLVAVLAVLVLVAGAQAEEEKAKLDNVPKAVLDTAKAQLPQGEITSATEVVESGQKLYRVTVREGDTETQLRISPDGRLLPGRTVTGRTSDDQSMPRRRGILRRDRERRLFVRRFGRF